MRHVTTSPSEGGLWVRWMGPGRDMDEIGQVGGRGWDVGAVGGTRGRQARWVGCGWVGRGQDVGRTWVR